MTDFFQDFTPGLDSPPARAQAIVPSDAAALPVVTRALNVASGGTVRVTTQAGDDVTVTIAAGITFPLRVRKVWATGTSATGIVGLS